MSMKSHNILSRLRNFNATVCTSALLFASFLIVCAVGLVSSTAQSTQKEERELEDKIPKHLPLKVKVKNLKNEKWAHDLEVEVTNTSNKPIYYLFLILTLPEVKSESNRTMGFQLIYGRSELVDFAAPLKPEDMPIKPGESYTLKIPQQFSLGWEQFAAKRKLPKAEPKKIKIRFGQLNFGDGTGFSFTDGSPIDIHQQQSSNVSCGETKKPSTAFMNMSSGRSPDSSPQPAAFFLPANFLPVKLSMADASELTSNMTLPAADVCGCQGGSCYRLKYAIAACCGYGVNIAASAGCTDPQGRCATVEDEEFSCSGDYPLHRSRSSLMPYSTYAHTVALA
jgi:hypothetical protein